MSLDDQRMIQVMNQQFFKELIKKERTLGVSNDSLVDYAELDWRLCMSQFFMDFGDRLALGKKIAQGGQAEICEALFDGKEAAIRNDFRRFGCKPKTSLLLKDGRFAFLMRRYWGDLRKAINIQIVKDKTHLKPPFPPSVSTHIMFHIMFQIACGMVVLHEADTLHRDLKAANMLVRNDIEMSMRSFENELVSDGAVICDVADFESVEGVMGTSFWRAPEVLSIMRSRAEDKYTDPTIWTEKVDVYSFAMACYKVLTGCIPFQFRRANDYNIGDERPSLLDYVDEEIQDLLRRCWDSEPLKRPSFKNICDELRKLVDMKVQYCESIAEDKRDVDAKRWVMFVKRGYYNLKYI